MFMIPCTLRQLEIFLAAAEDCHFMRTANRFGISQAAVSSHIATLEAQLGKRLFVRRRGSKPTLSSHGLALLSQARSFVAEAAKIRGFGTKSADERAVVRLGAGEHLLEDCIKPRLPEFYLQHSKLDLDCRRIDAPRQGAQLVQDGRMDLLLVHVSDPHDYPLHAEVLQQVRFGLYASAKYAASRSAGASALSALPFLLPIEGTEAGRIVQHALLEAGIVCRNVAARSPFADVRKDMAGQGHGVAPLLETMVRPEDGLIELGVELPPMYRTLFRVKRPPSRAVQTVAAFLKERLAS